VIYFQKVDKITYIHPQLPQLLTKSKPAVNTSAYHPYHHPGHRYRQNRPYSTTYGTKSGSQGQFEGIQGNILSTSCKLPVHLDFISLWYLTRSRPKPTKTHPPGRRRTRDRSAENRNATATIIIGLLPLRFPRSTGAMGRSWQAFNLFYLLGTKHPQRTHFPTVPT
jgi:hypothetical protein